MNNAGHDAGPTLAANITSSLGTKAFLLAAATPATAVVKQMMMIDSDRLTSSPVHSTEDNALAVV